jgi:hypothetical protein
MNFDQKKAIKAYSDLAKKMLQFVRHSLAVKSWLIWTKTTTKMMIFRNI